MPQSNLGLVIVLSFLITACSNNEQEVKKLSFNECKDKTIKQVFDKNFTDHKWKSFTKDKREFVQFNGIITSSKNEKEQVIFSFSKNDVGLWAPTSIYVGGNNVTLLSFMFMNELCNKK